MTLTKFREEIEYLLKNAETEYKKARQRGDAGRDLGFLLYGRIDTLRDIKRLATHLPLDK